MIKKIIIKVLLFAGMLVVLNYIYVFFFYEQDLQKHSDVINLIRDIPDNSDIIYLGESSNVTWRDDDYDKRPISGFIDAHLPELNVYDITKPASHAGIYKTLLQNVPKSNQAKTIIVTLNLRSFNAQWMYSKLETPLQKSMVLLRPGPPLLNRFLLSFKAYDIKSNEERDKQIKESWKNDTLNFPHEFPYDNLFDWNKQFSRKGIKDKNGNIDYENTELASHYIKAYAFQIDTTNHPRLQDFEDIIELCEKRGWNLILNLLAENTDKAGELVGENLLFLMKQNRDKLIKYFEDRGLLVVDNLTAVRNDQFIDQNWTTEHYAEKGRKIIAKNVAKATEKFYPGEFRSLKYLSEPQRVHFNDCEKKYTWAPSETLTSEKAFSGKKSSKTGNGNKYSVSFVSSIMRLPDTALNQVQINLMFNAASLNHKASLVVQIIGENYDGFYQAIALQDKDKNPGEWNRFMGNVVLPQNIRSAEIIKIYVYNPSDEIVYIDDFRIEFM